MKRTATKVVAPRRVELLEEELPSLKPDEVLIKIASCGVCQTEIPVYDGVVQGTPGVSFRYRDYPSDLGHEVSGIVADAGYDVTGIKVGQRVTGIVYSGCGFATHIIEKAKWLVPVQDHVSLAHALGEPIMSVVNIVRLSQVDFADTVYVVGTGYMALLTVAVLTHYPLSDIIISGHYPERLVMAERFGATLTINANKQDPWQMVMDRTAGQGVDVVIELTGVMNNLRLGASVCKAKKRARLVMAGVYNNNESFALGHYLQNRAPMLVAAYPNQSPNMMDDLQRGMWALDHGWLPMADLVTHRFPLTDVSRAIELARTKADGYIKGIIVPDESLL